MKEKLKKLLRRILKNKGSSFIGLAAAIVAILKFCGIELIDESTLTQVLSWIVVILGFLYGQNKKE